VDTGGSDFGWMHLHQGGRYDAATKLAHFRWRDLHVELGRWTRQDPAGYVDGANLSAFVTSNPPTFVDPFGRAHFNYEPFIPYARFADPATLVQTRLDQARVMTPLFVAALATAHPVLYTGMIFGLGFVIAVGAGVGAGYLITENTSIDETLGDWIAGADLVPGPNGGIMYQ
jgi:RHS repeat-associated protein